MNTHETTVATDFACPLEVHATAMETMTAMTAQGLHGSFELAQSPVVCIAVPAVMLEAARRKGGCGARLGWTRNGDELVGVLMAYADSHFAAAMFDLGEPAVQQMARNALAEGCLRLVLQNGQDRALVTPDLSEAYRRAYEESLKARPVSASSFVDAIASLTQTFSRAQTFEGMGIDAQRLQSATLSVCMPRGGTSALSVREVGSFQETVLH